MPPRHRPSRRRLLVPLTAAALVALASGPVAASADESSDRVDHAADTVWWAFADGIAPPLKDAKAARAVLEEHAAGLSGRARESARLHSDPVDAMLAKAAWAAGDGKAATARAEAVLASVNEAPEWDRGNLVHEMQVLRGRVALERGDLDEAAARLASAGKVPGSPQLDSFGPDWTLAEDLLAKGKRDAVAAYVDAVGGFWTSGREQLASWKKDLAEGRTPRFVPHRDGKVPSRPKRELPPPAGTPDGILGLWESVSTSVGGIGSALELRADGTARTRMVILRHGRYRIDGDRLVAADGDASESVPLGTVGKDRWTVEGADGTRVERRRVGDSVPDQPALVGVWARTITSPDGSATAYERYGADGWFSYRMLLPGLVTGVYERSGATLRIAWGREQARTFRAAVEGDRLRLTSDEGETSEYRWAGATPWYPFAEP